jgi:hypothetical protein
MTVDQEMRTLSSPVGRAGEHDRMARRGTQFGVEAELPAVLHEPGGAVFKVRFVGRLSGDAGKAQKFAQFVNEARLIGFEVTEDGFHRDYGHVLPFWKRWQNE